VASGKAKLKTRMATHEVTDGPLADAPELSPWYACSTRSAIQQIPSFYRAEMFISVFA